MPLYGGQILAGGNRFASYDGKLPPYVNELVNVMHPAAARVSDIPTQQIEKEYVWLKDAIARYRTTANNGSRPLKARTHAAHYVSYLSQTFARVKEGLEERQRRVQL